MIDPRAELLADLDNSKARVINPPGYIVVCGGPTDISPGQECISARNVFLTQLAITSPELARRQLLPEQIKEWNHYGVYSDLLAFETDLAHLTGAVVLFVESPGSIAELGSFSCIPDLAKKLLVIIRDEYFYKDSFIALGPIKSLEERHPGSVCVYNWNIDNTDFAPHIPHLVDTLKRFVKNPGKSESYSASSIKHKLLLIADLVDLFVVIKETEIKEWLEKYFEIPLKQPQLQQYLFLLTQLGLIIKARYGDNPFLVAAKDAIPYIEYGTKTIPFRQERVRLKARVLAYYEAEDKSRLNAWKSAVAKLNGQQQ